MTLLEKSVTQKLVTAKVDVITLRLCLDTENGRKRRYDTLKIAAQAAGPYLVTCDKNFQTG